MENKKEKGRNVKLRMFNVVIQPVGQQKEENYVALIDYIFNDGKSFCTAPDKFTKLRAINKAGHIIYGTLVNYTVLKEGSPWYNTETNSFEEHPVDPSLNPNAKEWDFYFDTEHHRIAVISKRGISFPQIYNYFTQAFAKASEVMPFDDITVNSITSNEGIELIFALEEIESLTVEVSYSNNDNNEDWEAAIDNQLQEMGAGRIKTTVKAPKKGRMALKSDSFLGGMIKLSKNNGSAKAEGKLEGKKTKVNTDSYPREIILNKVTEENLLAKIKSAIASLL